MSILDEFPEDKRIRYGIPAKIDGVEREDDDVKGRKEFHRKIKTDGISLRTFCIRKLRRSEYENFLHYLKSERTDRDDYENAMQSYMEE